MLASRRGRSLRSHTHPSTHRERLNTPNNNILFWHVLGAAYTRLEAWGVGITGHGHGYLHAVGHRLLLKLPLGLSRERVWGVKNSLLNSANIQQALFPHDLVESLRSPQVGMTILPISQMRTWRRGEAKAFAWRCTARKWQSWGVTPAGDSRGSVLSAFLLESVLHLCLVQKANDAHHRGVFT